MTRGGTNVMTPRSNCSSRSGRSFKSSSRGQNTTSARFKSQTVERMTFEESSGVKRRFESVLNVRKTLDKRTSQKLRFSLDSPERNEDLSGGPSRSPPIRGTSTEAVKSSSLTLTNQVARNVTIANEVNKPESILKT